MGALADGCHACAKDDFTEIADLGPQPIAHRLLRPGDDGSAELRHGLAVHACRACGLLQILDPIQPEELYRDYNFCFTSWKPQPHMAEEAALVRDIAPGKGTILEIGCNDGTFLLELRRAGLGPLVGIEPNRVSASVARRIGVDSTVYEEFFDERAARRLVGSHGPFRAVVMRQVLEHVADLPGTLRAIRGALAPGGMFLVEVPDFEGPLEAGDVSALWEEHVNYFTEPVLISLLEAHGFKAVETRRYPFSGGALMVAAGSGGAPHALTVRRESVARVLGEAAKYRLRIDRFRRAFLKILEVGKREGAVNVLYGAGCRATVAVNGLGAGRLLDFAVDDQKDKHGLRLAGCHLEIRPSDALREGKVNCFLSVNHENEAQVMKRHDGILAKGGRFYSLNSPSPLFRGILGGGGL